MEISFNYRESRGWPSRDLKLPFNNPAWKTVMILWASICHGQIIPGSGLLLHFSPRPNSFLSFLFLASLRRVRMTVNDVLEFLIIGKSWSSTLPGRNLFPAGKWKLYIYISFALVHVQSRPLLLGLTWSDLLIYGHPGGKTFTIIYRTKMKGPITPPLGESSDNDSLRSPMSSRQPLRLLPFF